MTSNSERSFAKENCRTVFAVLDHQCLRPHGQHLLRGPRQVLLIRQHLGFSIIDQQHIDQLQRFSQFGARTELAETLKLVNVLLINDTETKMLADEKNLPRAAQKVLAMGPQALGIKHGEYGWTIFLL